MAFALSANTAARLRSKLAELPASSPRSAGHGVGPNAWLVVTGGPDVDGWYTATITRPDGGTTEGLATDALVKSVTGAGLTAGVPYPCYRTGNHTDGRPRFLAPVDEEEITVVTAVSLGCNLGTPTVSATTQTVRIRGVGLSVEAV